MSALGTVSAWVDALDDLLVDPERVTWTESARVTFLNLATDLLRESRPDAFVDDIEIPLVPGTSQKAPPGVVSFVGAPRNVCLDASGQVALSSEVSVVDKNTVMAFAAFRSCAPVPQAPAGHASATPSPPGVARCSEWSMQGFESSAKTPGFFSVTPPVPVGVTAKIKVRVQQCAPTYSWPEDRDTQVVCRHKSLLLEMILYYAYQTPQESELALNRAAQHAQRFERMLGFAYKMQSRFEGGYFLGVKPDGQPDERVV